MRTANIMALLGFVIGLAYELTAIPPHIQAHSYDTLTCVLLLVAGFVVDFVFGYRLFNSSIHN